MAGTYKATGINLKGMPLGESDRLLTVLTKEFGLMRLVAPGARKHQSSLRGRSGLFVVNQLLIAKGRNLDKIIQAEGLESYPGLSQDLRKLTASQYMAELVLYQALSNQPQEELFLMLSQHLDRLETLPTDLVLPSLLQATFHLLTMAGVTPQVNACCLTQQPLVPDFTNLDWRVGFHAAAGGTVTLSELERSLANERSISQSKSTTPSVPPPSFPDQRGRAVKRAVPYLAREPRSHTSPELATRLTATQLAVLQWLAKPTGMTADGAAASDPFLPQPPSDPSWLSIERVLRHYAQYHFERPIRSAALIDTCFLSLPLSYPEP